ncbi:efflux transporter outer membrane subunit, partial [Duganella sp. FT134W]
SLQAAEASLRQSQASLRAGAGVFYPQLDLSLSAQRQRQSPLRAAGAGAGVYNLVTLSVAVSYALDVFGGQRRAVEALAAQADAQHAALQGAYLTLSGNVVNSLIARAAYRAQIEATSRFIARQQDQLAIAEARATAGIAPYTDVLAVRSQLAASRALLPPLLHKQDQADHLLASLSGVSPGQWRAPVLELAALALPAQLPLSLPSELVRQRPDVLAAEARLHGASAAIGVATAALLPSLRLD